MPISLEKTQAFIASAQKAQLSPEATVTAFRDYLASDENEPSIRDMDEPSQLATAKQILDENQPPGFMRQAAEFLPVVGPGLTAARTRELRPATEALAGMVGLEEQEMGSAGLFLAETVREVGEIAATIPLGIGAARMVAPTVGRAALSQTAKNFLIRGIGGATDAGLAVGIAATEYAAAGEEDRAGAIMNRAWIPLLIGTAIGLGTNRFLDKYVQPEVAAKVGTNLIQNPAFQAKVKQEEPIVMAFAKHLGQDKEAASEVFMRAAQGQASEGEFAALRSFARGTPEYADSELVQRGIVESGKVQLRTKAFESHEPLSVRVERMDGTIADVVVKGGSAGAKQLKDLTDAHAAGDVHVSMVRGKGANTVAPRFRIDPKAIQNRLEQMAELPAKHAALAEGQFTDFLESGLLRPDGRLTTPRHDLLGDIAESGSLREVSTMRQAGQETALLSQVSRDVPGSFQRSPLAGEHELAQGRIQRSRAGTDLFFHEGSILQQGQESSIPGGFERSPLLDVERGAVLDPQTIQLDTILSLTRQEILQGDMPMVSMAQAPQRGTMSGAPAETLSFAQPVDIMGGMARPRQITGRIGGEGFGVQPAPHVRRVLAQASTEGKKRLNTADIQEILGVDRDQARRVYQELRSSGAVGEGGLLSKRALDLGERTEIRPMTPVTKSPVPGDVMVDSSGKATKVTKVTPPFVETTPTRQGAAPTTRTLLADGTLGEVAPVKFRELVRSALGSKPGSRASQRLERLFARIQRGDEAAIDELDSLFQRASRTRLEKMQGQVRQQREALESTSLADDAELYTMHEALKRIEQRVQDIPDNPGLTHTQLRDCP